MSINLSALPIPLREGDSRGDYVMMTWLYALLVLSERYGPLQGKPRKDEMDFVFMLLLQAWEN